MALYRGNVIRLLSKKLFCILLVLLTSNTFAGGGLFKEVSKPAGYIKDRASHSALWDWDFLEPKQTSRKALYGYMIDRLERELKLATKVLKSFEYDAYIVSNSCAERVEKLNQFKSEKSNLSDNTKSLIDIVLLEVGHKKFEKKSKLAHKLYQSYVKAISQTLDLVKNLEKERTRHSFEELKGIILENIYSDENYEAAVYKTFAAWSKNTYQTIEYDDVKLRKKEVNSQESLEKLLPLNRILNLYEKDLRIPEFHPIQLQSGKKSQEYIAEVIRPASAFKYKEDNEYRVMRVSVTGQRGTLNLISDIELIDRLLWSEKAGKPLTFQFGKGFFESFGYDAKSHTYRADVVMSRCEDDWEDLFNFKSHPCISTSSFDPKEFLENFN